MSLRQTAVEGILAFTCYSTKKMPKDLRTSFELPGDPYDENIAISLSGTSYLKSLGVFFYRDELNGNGTIIEPSDNGTSIQEEKNFPAYKYMGQLFYDSLKIAPWIEPTPEIIAKNGDDSAWLKWEEPVNVVAFDKYSVSLS